MRLFGRRTKPRSSSLQLCVLAASDVPALAVLIFLLDDDADGLAMSGNVALVEGDQLPEEGLEMHDLGLLLQWCVVRGWGENGE